MNRERPIRLPEQFPSFANRSWGRDMNMLHHFAGYTDRSQIETLGQQLTGRPIRFGDRFSSHFLPDDLYEFLSPKYSLHDVEFNIWQFMDEEGTPAERAGFRTQIDDIIRLAYCEYRTDMPENVGILLSWVNPKTEESVFRDVSIYPGNTVIDRRALVYKVGDVEYPVVWYGDPHMHIGMVPKFRQVDVVYDRHPQNGMELAYARQAVFNAEEDTYAAHEYSFDVDEREIDYRSHVGEKAVEVFKEEIEDTFPPDESLEGVSVSVWSD